MEKISDIDLARQKVLNDMNLFFSEVRALVGDNVFEMLEGMDKLRKVRSAVYENINQIQHEYLILQGLVWLGSDKKLPQNIDWYWNPRQTGDFSEPDLRGVIDGNVIISAEATSSEKPQGVIDTRMKKTLAKLSEMPGKKILFYQDKLHGEKSNDEGKKE